MVCSLADIRMKQFEDNGYSREDYIRAHAFLTELKKYAPLVKPADRKRLRHQALSGDIAGAESGLWECVRRARYE